MRKGIDKRGGTRMVDRGPFRERAVKMMAFERTGGRAGAILHVAPRILAE